MNVVRRAEEEDAFSKASDKFSDWNMDVSKIGKADGGTMGAGVRFRKIKRLVRPRSCRARV